MEKVKYYCDYNWVPVSFPFVVEFNIEKWESMSAEFFCGKNRFLCCISDDQTISISRDNNSNIFFVERIFSLPDNTTDIFSSSSQKEAEEEFLNLIENKLK